ncbi:phosphoribosyltransferase [Candidatus Parcubacteria bacterium]|jgi:orotate phosphoribosyltransferase|nr:MAG: phosphoribosyltransferase [Candidatus Parcubacteria bacterium]
MSKKPFDWQMHFSQAGIFQTGHYVLSSQKHSKVYANFVKPINLDHGVFQSIVYGLLDLVDCSIFQYVNQVAVLGIGTGAFYAHQFTQQLFKNLLQNGRYGRITCDFVFAARKPTGDLFLAYDQAKILEGKNVIFVDDVYSTGKTLAEAQRLIKSANGVLVQAIFILNRAPEPLAEVILLEHPMKESGCLLHHPIELWPNRAACPLCQQGVPFSTEYGKGEQEFTLHGQPSSE